MSVYIRGMEMPTTCCHCKMMVCNPELVWDDVVVERTGAWVCLLTGELIDNTKREEHCPLIPVPDHGRLGDLDKLEDYFKAYKWDKAADIVCFAPTIIPATAKEVADRLVRSAKFREKVAEKVSE